MIIMEIQRSDIHCMEGIDLLAIQRKSLGRAFFLYNFVRDVRSSGVRSFITIVHIPKFFKMLQYFVRFRFLLGIAKVYYVKEKL